MIVPGGTANELPFVALVDMADEHFGRLARSC
jgi:hypothetical protein